MTKTPDSWSRIDDSMVESAIRRGANRRDLLKMLMAGGVSLAAANLLVGRADAAVAEEPVKGGTLKAAGWSSSTTTGPSSSFGTPPASRWPAG